MIGLLYLGLALAEVPSGCRVPAGERILAADLAASLPAFAAVPSDTEIAWAPAPGARRRFAPAEIERLAARHGVKLDGARAVCFERRLAPLDPAALRAALESALAGQNARLELVDHLKAPVPEGTLEFPRSGLARPAARAPAVWRGHVRYGDGRSYPVWARVRITVARRRVVALQTLAAGEPVAPGSVEVRQMEGFPFEEPAPASLDDVAGRLPRRLIAAGQPIEARHLALAREVEAGRTVQVEARSGAARLAFEARAESPGRLGETVVVRNPATGKRFRAVVQARGKVTVEEAGNQDGKNPTHLGSAGGAGGGRPRPQAP